MFELYSMGRWRNSIGGRWVPNNDIRPNSRATTERNYTYLRSYKEKRFLFIQKEREGEGMRVCVCVRRVADYVQMHITLWNYAIPHLSLRLSPALPWVGALRLFCDPVTIVRSISICTTRRGPSTSSSSAASATAWASKRAHNLLLKPILARTKNSLKQNDDDDDWAIVRWSLRLLGRRLEKGYNCIATKKCIETILLCQLLGAHSPIDSRLHLQSCGPGF